MMRESKYVVQVNEAPKALRVDPAIVESMKGAISNKNISRMRKEYVDCPVSQQQVAFLLCFNCVSFIRRVKGKVYCEGKEYRLRME